MGIPPLLYFLFLSFSRRHSNVPFYQPIAGTEDAALKRRIVIVSRKDNLYCACLLPAEPPNRN
jgi:hypothetical protein